MSNKTQTSIEWLIEHIKSTEWQDMYIWHKEEIFQQAKAMQKQEIIDAFMGYETYSSENLELAEQYYEETFGGNNEQQ